MAPNKVTGSNKEPISLKDVGFFVAQRHHDGLKGDLALHLSGGWSIITLLPIGRSHVCI
ncbi:hypothetical protein AERO9A_340072 [Aeromonas salmonicida]|nr:hypothetical protein AERO9A_340072 [Aeromonas salmonicida]